MNYEIILASGSPRRKAFFEQMGYPFIQKVISIEESFPESLSAEAITEYLVKLTRFSGSVKQAIDYAKIVQEDNTNSDITAFIIENDFSGFSVSPKLDKLGMRGSNTAELVFNNCEVPVENVLGKMNKGVSVLMSGLDYERAVLSGGPLGIMSACWDIVIPYVKERKQFGSVIGTFQALQHRAAEMYSELELTKSSVIAACNAVDENSNDLKLSLIHI